MDRLRNCFALIIVVLTLAACGSSSRAIATRNSLAAPQGSASATVKVWVNTASGVYHCPGTRWYGNTKRGEFMTQREAQSKGYRPANGAVCG